ncbi:MAG: hypothetical protein HQM12_08950 [SAR324 cluster bacterium]|nr:hypothetical protein [SAR324 cluster bacterium]
MIRKIFEMRSEDGSEFPLPTKQWIAKIIGGSIIADGVVHRNEHIYLENLFSMMKDEPQALLIIRDIIRNGEIPEIENINIDPRMAEKVFKGVLEICACDHEISPSEIKYINQAGTALNIDMLRVHKLINSTLRKVKIEFFNQLLEELQPDEKRWLAIIILKCVYADGKVHYREIPYLNDVFELVDSDQQALSRIKQDAVDIPLNQLPKVYFDEEIKRDIMRYILEIVMGDEDLDESEELLIHGIADAIEFDREQLYSLMDTVEQVKFFIRASAELME